MLILPDSALLAVLHPALWALDYFPHCISRASWCAPLSSRSLAQQCRMVEAAAACDVPAWPSMYTKHQPPIPTAVALPLCTLRLLPCALLPQLIFTVFLLLLLMMRDCPGSLQGYCWLYETIFLRSCEETAMHDLEEKALTASSCIMKGWSGQAW